MILSATDDIRGVTTTGSAVNYTISVQEKSTASGLVWNLGVTSNLPTTATDLYSCPASTQAIVDEVTLHNTNATAQEITMYIRKAAGTAYIWYHLTLQQDESAHYIRGVGWAVYNESGSIRPAENTRAGTSFPSAPFDGQPFYRTDLDFDFNWDLGRGKWLGPLETHQFSRAGTTSAGQVLRYGGNLIADPFGTTAFYLPYDITIVGISCGHASTSSAGDELVIIDQTSASTNQIAYVGSSMTTGNLQDEDMTIDADMSQHDFMGVAYLNWGTTASPTTQLTDAWLVAYIRRHET